MKNRKSRSMIAALALSIALLSGCSSTGNEGNTGSDNKGASDAPKSSVSTEAFNKTGLPIVGKPIKLTMMGAEDMQRNWEDLYFFKGMEADTNIQFDFTTLPSSSYMERKNLAFASNELPDLFFMGGLSSNDEVNYGAQGMLIPLEQLIADYAPTLTKLFQDYPEIRKSITAPDGHIYALPQIADHPRDRFLRLFVNGEWLKKLNISELPKTVDEFYDLLVMFRDKDPNQNGKADEIPLTGDNKLSYIRPIMLSYFGYVSDFIDVSDDKVRFVPVQQGYKNYLTLMNKLYAEKLLDNEIFSQNKAQMTAKGENGLYGVMGNSLPVFGGKEKQVVPHNILDNPQMPPLVSEAGATPIFPERDTIRRGSFAITSANKHPEATIRWLDHLYTEEGYLHAQYGIEGESYRWSDTEPKYIEYIVPEGMLENDFKNMKVSNLGYGFANEALERKFLKSDWLGFVLNDQVGQYIDHGKKAFPLTYFTEEELQRVNAITVDLQTFIEQMEAKIVVGQEPVSKWEDYVQTMNKMGVEELVSIYQASYDRWNSAN
ncbi:extracellular solute-binding protein [Paenibacillus mendelii]|uniref:Extracellular solute-binding protein n=1 Tax=Paenibacillus mendelii TaxID=206163 RepID=A0ABV6JCH4_9BACL|nr:extracellular solute-binding protein [Paenibacillus mendelii]MCQ6561603.1 extracellular solute-binding protein [Paenibacillus mendelii]